MKHFDFLLQHGIILPDYSHKAEASRAASRLGTTLDGLVDRLNLSVTDRHALEQQVSAELQEFLALVVSDASDAACDTSDLDDEIEDLNDQIRDLNDDKDNLNIDLDEARKELQKANARIAEMAAAKAPEV